MKTQDGTDDWSKMETGISYASAYMSREANRLSSFNLEDIILL